MLNFEEYVKDLPEGLSEKYLTRFSVYNKYNKPDMSSFDDLLINHIVHIKTTEIPRSQLIIAPARLEKWGMYSTVVVDGINQYAKDLNLYNYIFYSPNTKKTYNTKEQVIADKNTIKLPPLPKVPTKNKTVSILAKTKELNDFAFNVRNPAKNLTQKVYTKGFTCPHRLTNDVDVMIAEGIITPPSTTCQLCQEPNIICPHSVDFNNLKKYEKREPQEHTIDVYCKKCDELLYSEEKTTTKFISNDNLVYNVDEDDILITSRIKSTLSQLSLHIIEISQRVDVLELSSIIENRIQQYLKVTIAKHDITKKKLIVTIATLAALTQLALSNPKQIVVAKYFKAMKSNMVINLTKAFIFLNNLGGRTQIDKFIDNQKDLIDSIVGSVATMFSMNDKLTEYSEIDLTLEDLERNPLFIVLCSTYKVDNKQIINNLRNKQSVELGGTLKTIEDVYNKMLELLKKLNAKKILTHKITYQPSRPTKYKRISDTVKYKQPIATLSQDTLQNNEEQLEYPSKIKTVNRLKGYGSQLWAKVVKFVLQENSYEFKKFIMDSVKRNKISYDDIINMKIPDIIKKSIQPKKKTKLVVLDTNPTEPTNETDYEPSEVETRLPFDNFNEDNEDTDLEVSED